MQEYYYEISQFFWDKAENAFYSEGWNLHAELKDGTIHPEAFPNGKQQFTIRNSATGGFRRFTFSDSVTEYFTDSEGGYWEIDNWVFESEDGIKCYIMINP